MSEVQGGGVETPMKRSKSDEDNNNNDSNNNNPLDALKPLIAEPESWQELQGAARVPFSVPCNRCGGALQLHGSAEDVPLPGEWRYVALCASCNGCDVFELHRVTHEDDL